MTDVAPYRRILIKLSGEALAGSDGYGIDQEIVSHIVKEILPVKEMGVEIALVCGAGNLFRGAEHVATPSNAIHSISAKTPGTLGFKRATGDYMGMLATIMNSLALQNQFENFGIQTRLQSAIHMPEICEPFSLRRALRHLEKGRLVIFGGGTGHPFFTTDTTAALRATEIEADVILKATKVDGVYDCDPKRNPNARRYEKISYEETLERRLKVMDSTAISLCMDNNIPIIVFDFFKQGNLLRLLKGETSLGTIVGGSV